MGKSISIIIPAFNEEGNIKKVITRCLEVLPKLFEQFEIIAINDGSKDRTGEILESLKNQFKNLKVFHHLKNEGMGSAVRTGIQNAKNDLIFTISADLQYDISELEKFLVPIKEADIVIGSRLKRDYRGWRNIATFVYRIFLNLMFCLKFEDSTSIKLFKRNVFEKISVDSSGFFWEVEVLIKAKRAGFMIKETRVYSKKRMLGKSSLENPLEVFKIILEMIKFRLKQS
ncbi:MAG: hypothetical protein COX90_02785 [Candidatus Nealsonbacteria bacterium CG_4_10_14_0_2_um_filter_38_17]|uniref:Glycosyltransferase 2-like domain-containing protein n=2 Tax=Candidatus Nealsoniibacteriota TaxID=1817911 RepID=A0A2M7UXQ4_9BACT|nr:MAG: hypothetical protein COX36_03825 [Candidatus Nealsonbacteria bacterium CG23_combo_of_CG06-09_8_20_14_all_38_19]PIZ88771.1 MAG: hypothetical protein COX90_02785 [Candidatus Nealsonbacteria bacterium CG_4_10_14_0_2_um_filter_38_17]